MIRENWFEKDATTLATKLQQREVSAVELLTWHRDRIEAINPHLNAVVTTDFDQALSRARAADEALARGEIWGPLHGVPMTIDFVGEVIKGRPKRQKGQCE